MSKNYTGWTIHVSVDPFAGSPIDRTFTVEPYSGTERCMVTSGSQPKADYVVRGYGVTEDGIMDGSDVYVSQSGMEMLEEMFEPDDSGETWTAPTPPNAEELLATYGDRAQVVRYSNGDTQVIVRFY